MRSILLASLLAILASVALLGADALDVYFIDVGQGGAILIDYGDWEALLDAGPGFISSNSEILATLADHVRDGIIELAILSHPHADHYGGFRTVLGQYEVGSFWRSQDTDPDTHGPKYSTFLDALALENLVPIQLEAGEQVTFGQLQWTVLGPEELVGGSENDNENSLVLLARYGEVHFLFVGDIETAGELALQDIELPEGSLILKVAHHGSATSTSTGFLAWAQPALAVISTKYDEPPATGVLESLAIPYVMTSEYGTIQVCTDGESFTTPVPTSTTMFVDADGNKVSAYTDEDLICVKVIDPSHAGASLLVNALEIDDETYDLALWYDVQTCAAEGTFLTEALDLDLTAGESITATYTDPTDSTDTSSDTVSIVPDGERFYAGPSPFDVDCTFGYIGTGIADVMSVEVYDLSGALLWAEQQSNVREIVWDGTDAAGLPLANGAYIYVITATDGTNTFSGKGVVFVRR